MHGARVFTAILLLTSAIAPGEPTTNISETELASLGDDILSTPNHEASSPQAYRLHELGASADPLIPRLVQGTADDGTADALYRRQRAIEALGAIASPASVSALIPMMRNANNQTFVHKAIVSAGDQALKPIEAVIAQQPATLQMGLISILRQIGSVPATLSLDRIAGLPVQAATADEARQVARRLRELASPDFAESLRQSHQSPSDLPHCGLAGLDAAISMLLHTDPGIRRQGTVAAQGAMNMFEVYKRVSDMAPVLTKRRADIQKLLEDKDPEVLRNAKRLARFAGIEVPKLVIKPPTSAPLGEQSEKRQQQLEQLVREEGPNAEPELMKVIRTDRDFGLRMRAAGILLGIPPFDQRIDRAIRGDVSILRAAAARRLVELGESGWRRLILVASQMPFSRVRELTSVAPDAAGRRVALSLLDGDDPKVALPATLLLSNAPTDARPALQPSAKALAKMGQVLADANPRKRAAVSAAWIRMPLLTAEPVLDLLKHDNPVVRRAAAITLAGDDSTPYRKNMLPLTALGALLAAADDPDAQVRQHVAIALTRLLDRKETRPVSPEGGLGFNVNTVASPPEVRVPALAKLDQLLNDPDPDVRGAVVCYLFGAHDGYNQMIRIHQHRDASVSKLADYLIRLRQSRSPRDKPAALPTGEAIQILADPNQSSYAKVFMAQELKSQGESAAAAIPVLIAQLNLSKPLRLRCAAAESLGAVGKGSREAAVALTQTLDDWNPNVVGFALRSLGQVGPAAKDALPRLLAIINSPQSEEESRELQSHRAIALDALPKLGPDSVRGLIALLELGDPSSIYRASEKLRPLGPDAAPAVPALINTLRQKPPSRLAGMVSQVLGAIGPAAADAAPAIADCWPSASLMDRRELAEALGNIGPGAATPQVIALLTSPGHYGRPDGDYNVALGKMGPAAIAAAPTLIAQVEKVVEAREREIPQPGNHFINDIYGAEQQAIRALGKMGPAARAALPVLQRGMKIYQPRGEGVNLAVLRQAIARIEGREPLNLPDNWGPPVPRDPPGPREVPYDPNRDNRPPDLGGPFGPQ